MKRTVVLVLIALSLAGLALAAPAMAAETKVTARGSDFGTMLWAPQRQAIYYFDGDRRNAPRCYGGCARAWPPVLTKGRPEAGKGVQDDLLGTTRRRNGDRQVTYDGKPLYTYAHEGAGQVLCHDIFLNGGYWWALGPNGDRLP